MKNSKSFLGQGWAFPPTFVRDLNTAMLSSQNQNIQENLHILISTQCGERLMLEDYGTRLRTFVFESPDGDLFNAIQDTIKNAILLYEPRIKLEEVVVVSDPTQDNTLLVTVNYIIRTTNNRSNFVHPFHLTEGTNLKTP